jgi:uncharacterized membrane protein
LNRFLAAAAFTVAGLVGAAALAVSAYLAPGEPTRFLAPGAGTVEIRQAGRYVIWHEYRTTFENRVYASPPGLPAGARFTVRGPEGPPLPVGSVSRQTWSGGDAKRQAVGSFEAPVVGRYTVVLDGPFPSIVIAVTPDFMGHLLLAAGAAVLLAFFSIGGGLGLLIWALVGRNPAIADRPLAARGPPAVADAHRELREMAAVVYALYAASVLVGVTMLGGLVVAYLKRGDAAGTWLESHYRWQIRSFWWLLLWGAVGALTSVILVGFVVLFAAAVWFIYRIAKGWIALREGRPVGEAGAAPPAAPGQVPL